MRQAIGEPIRLLLLTRDNGGVPIVLKGYVQQNEIEQAVKRAEEALRPDVVHIRYSLGEDWSGAEALFFRVLLSNKASERTRLQEVARRVALRISQEVQPDEFGLQPYFNFRSESEQEALNEPAWA